MRNSANFSPIILDHHVLYLDDDHIGIYGTKMIGEKLAEFLMQKGLVNQR